jgi:pimeloyl-ACP methyl ester carboxylesterase
MCVDASLEVGRCGRLRPDLIGYGAHRTTPTNNLTLVDQAHHLLDHLTAMGREQIHLVGHSGLPRVAG